MALVKLVLKLFRMIRRFFRLNSKRKHNNAVKKINQPTWDDFFASSEETLVQKIYYYFEKTVHHQGGKGSTIFAIFIFAFMIATLSLALSKHALIYGLSALIVVLIFLTIFEVGKNLFGFFGGNKDDDESKDKKIVINNAVHYTDDYLSATDSERKTIIIDDSIKEVEKKILNNQVTSRITFAVASIFYVGILFEWSLISEVFKKITTEKFPQIMIILILIPVYIFFALFIRNPIVAVNRLSQNKVYEEVLTALRIAKDDAILGRKVDLIKPVIEKKPKRKGKKKKGKKIKIKTIKFK